MAKTIGYRGLDIFVGKCFDEFQWFHNTIEGENGNYADTELEAIENAKSSIDSYIASARDANERWSHITFYGGL